MRLFCRLLVCITYYEVFIHCQRGSPSGFKGNKYPGSGGLSTNLGGNTAGGGRNGNVKACKSGACKYTEIIVLSTFGGMGGVMTLVSLICYCYKRRIRRLPHRDSLLLELSKNSNGKYEACDIAVFKSGLWSSRYLQFGEWFGPKPFSLSFDLLSFKITGSGSDDVGTFIVSGTYSDKTAQIVLIKKYQLGTGDPTGNLGHRVLIRLTWNPKTAQFEGNWYVRTKVYCGSDQFELKLDEESKLWVTSISQ